MSFLSNIFKTKISSIDATKKESLKKDFISLWVKAYSVKDKGEFDNLYAEAYDIGTQINDIEYISWYDLDWESTGYPRPDTYRNIMFLLFKKQKDDLDKRIERQKKRQKSVSKMRSSMIQN